MLTGEQGARSVHDLNSLPLPALYAELSTGSLIRRVLELARDEDLTTPGGEAPCDVTSEMAIAPDARASATITSRSPGVIAGLASAPELLRVYESDCVFHVQRRDGERVSAGETIATMQGAARDILKIERTMLNLLSHLSGVATRTAHCVKLARARNEHVDLYDTRKTTPGLRLLEKYAVRCGGGMCHRLGLADAVLIKDNHLAGVETHDLCSSLTDMAQRARRLHPDLRFIEMEVDSLEQLEKALAVGSGLIDVVLLDNMSERQLREAVRLRNDAGSQVELEASGGVTTANIEMIAATGVDRASMGSLTHSAPALDIALEIESISDG